MGPRAGATGEEVRSRAAQTKTRVPRFFWRTTRRLNISRPMRPDYYSKPTGGGQFRRRAISRNLSLRTGTQKNMPRGGKPLGVDFSAEIHTTCGKLNARDWVRPIIKPVPHARAHSTHGAAKRNGLHLNYDNSQSAYNNNRRVNHNHYIPYVRQCMMQLPPPSQAQAPWWSSHVVAKSIFFFFLKPPATKKQRQSSHWLLSFAGHIPVTKHRKGAFAKHLSFLPYATAAPHTASKNKLQSTNQLTPINHHIKLRHPINFQPVKSIHQRRSTNQ